jgi:DNA-binding transcriptional MerR regulator
MIDLEYTITELEKLTGLNRRTIHFYTKLRIIPPPKGRAGGARYSNIHVFRLRLIKHLQPTHLKLTGIKEYLDSLQQRDLEMQFEKLEREAIEKLRAKASRSGQSEKSKSGPIQNLLEKIADSRQVGKSSWHRFEIADGIEIGIRDDKLRQHEMSINDWINKLAAALKR